MLELKVGDRVRSMEDGVMGTVMRREHDFEHARYVIAWDNGEQSEIWPNEDPDLEESRRFAGWEVVVSFEQNKAIVRRFLEDIVNRGQFEIAKEIFAVDYINHTAGGGIGSGRDGFVKSIKAVRAAFPDWTVTVNAMIAEGDLVSDHVSIRATHSGQAPGGPAPTHEAIAGEAMHLWRLSNGRLVEGWYYVTPEVILKVFAALSVPTQR